MIQTILYADDQLIIAESEDELQIAVNELNKIVKKYDMKISTTKTKTIGLFGKNIQMVKIKIEGKIIEQVSIFNYLGNLISNEEKDINIKLERYNKMNGIIKRHCGKHMTTDTKFRIHNITSKAALCYGSEIWTVNKRDAQKLEAAQTTFLRPLLGLTRLDRQRNSDIRNRLKVDNILEDIISHQKNWIYHLKRMDRNRIPKLASQYQPRGRRDIGRPRRRWRDQEHREP
jgi:hypothetical protein